LFTNRLARSELGNRSLQWARLVSLPATDFWPIHGSVLDAPLHTRSIEASLSAFPFTRLPHLQPCGLRHDRVVDPGHCLRCSSGLFPGPFGFELPSSHRFLGAGRLNIQNPFPVLTPESLSSLPMSAPHWGFTPSGS
jgi:hypothetical protein